MNKLYIYVGYTLLAFFRLVNFFFLSPRVQEMKFMTKKKTRYY